MRCLPGREIPERKPCVMVRRAHDQNSQRISRERVGTKPLSPCNLRHAIQSHGRGADRLAGDRQAQVELQTAVLPDRIAAGDIQHRGDDLAIAGAAAENPAQCVAHLGLIGVRVLRQQRGGGHKQARRADAALRRAVFEKRRLQRGQLAIGQPFDSCDPGSIDGRDRCQAGADRFTVDKHGAGPAVTGIAANLGSGELQLFAQD